MEQVTTIGLDIAKSVFQVHGIAADGTVVVRRQLRRGQVLPFFEKQAPCLVGIEACATAHHWAREIGARGHEVKLMPAKYVKAYVKRNKNDAADAEAICEAVSRPHMAVPGPLGDDDHTSGLTPSRGLYSGKPAVSNPVRYRASSRRRKASRTVVPAGEVRIQARLSHGDRNLLANI